MTRTEAAVARFREGLHCSEAVMEAWAPNLGVDARFARTISLPLAGGSGVGGECGAVAGAFLVLGLKFGAGGPENNETFMTVMTKVRELADGFKRRHGALNCCDLLGLDVFTEQGHKEFLAKGMRQTHCARYIEDVMNLLEQMVGSSSSNAR